MPMDIDAMAAHHAEGHHGGHGHDGHGAHHKAEHGHGTEPHKPAFGRAQSIADMVVEAAQKDGVYVVEDVSKTKTGVRSRKKARPLEYSNWRASNYRAGSQLKPIGAAHPEKPPRPGCKSLCEWFEHSTFSDFAKVGSVFSSIKLPRHYDCVCDHRGLSWIRHDRTKVLMWPVAIVVGVAHATEDDKEAGFADGTPDYATLFHYTDAKAMRTFTRAIAGGEKPLCILEHVADDFQSRACNQAGPDTTTETLCLTVLEPNKYRRGRDVLRDVYGPEPPRKAAASHCLPLQLPWYCLNNAVPRVDNDGLEEERDDRFSVDINEIVKVARVARIMKLQSERKCSILAARIMHMIGKRKKKGGLQKKIDGKTRRLYDAVERAKRRPNAIFQCHGFMVQERQVALRPEDDGGSEPPELSDGDEDYDDVSGEDALTASDEEHSANESAKESKSGSSDAGLEEGSGSDESAEGEE